MLEGGAEPAAVDAAFEGEVGCDPDAATTERGSGVRMMPDASNSGSDTKLDVGCCGGGLAEKDASVAIAADSAEKAEERPNSASELRTEGRDRVGTKSTPALPMLLPLLLPSEATGIVDDDGAALNCDGENSGSDEVELPSESREADRGALVGELSPEEALLRLRCRLGAAG